MIHLDKSFLYTLDIVLCQPWVLNPGFCLATGAGAVEGMGLPFNGSYKCSGHLQNAQLFSTATCTCHSCKTPPSSSIAATPASPSPPKLLHWGNKSSGEVVNWKKQALARPPWWVVIPLKVQYRIREFNNHSFRSRQIWYPHSQGENLWMVHILNCGAPIPCLIVQEFCTFARGWMGGVS